MTDDLRARLHEEMSHQQRPPLSGIADEAVRRGSRHRTTLRVASGAGITAVTGLAVAAVTLSSLAAPGHRSATLSGAAGAAPSAVAVPAPAASAPAVAVTTAPASAAAAATTAAPPALANPVVEVPATAGGMLALLQGLHPEAPLSHIAANPSGLAIQANLDLGNGEGMVRIWLFRNTATESDTCNAAGAQCLHQGGNLIRIEHPAGNCIEATMVTVIRPDNNAVSLADATCQMWNGTANVPSPAPLTQAQAIAIASDDLWSLSMDQALVQAGAKTYPTLPPIVGG